MLLVASLLSFGLAICSGYTIKDSRVVGGVATTPGEFPFVVSLRDTSNQHFCAGAIYNYQYVLTSASCLYNKRPSDVTVVAADNRLSATDPGERRVTVASIINHENFDVFTFSYDIAVLKLSTSLPFSTYINFVSLSAAPPEAESSATLIGWGSIQQGQPISDAQRKNTNVPVRSEGDCYAHNIFNPDSMFCAGGAGSNACTGDGGSPLVSSDGWLLGLVSYTRSCSDNLYPTIYTKIAQFSDWVFTNAGAQPPTTTASTSSTSSTTETSSTTSTTQSSSTTATTATSTVTSTTAATTTPSTTTLSTPSIPTTTSDTTTVETTSASIGTDTTLDTTTTDIPTTVLSTT